MISAQKSVQPGCDRQKPVDGYKNQLASLEPAKGANLIISKGAALHV